MTITTPSGAFLVPDMDSAELKRAQIVESVLPQLRAHAEEADRNGSFYQPHKQMLQESELLGLVVPEKFGGLGGTLRDLAAATFAMGSACPSTALAYFFHCSSVSRGLLALEASESNEFSPTDRDTIRRFGEQVLHKMGRDHLLLGNFASESAKSAKSAIFISTEAAEVKAGWELNGIKAFGCNSGVADEYLITAKLAGSDSAAGIALFLVPSDSPGVSERPQWDALGMRATASHGVILENVFVTPRAGANHPRGLCGHDECQSRLPAREPAGHLSHLSRGCETKF